VLRSKERQLLESSLAREAEQQRSAALRKSNAELKAEI